MSDIADNWGDLVDAQIKQQGTAAIRVKDGTVFTFTKETLEKLLDASQKTGKAIVFVKTGARA